MKLTKTQLRYRGELLIEAAIEHGESRTIRWMKTPVTRGIINAMSALREKKNENETVGNIIAKSC